MCRQGDSENTINKLLLMQSEYDRISLLMILPL
jgi:hypothetical protein